MSGLGERLAVLAHVGDDKCRQLVATVDWTDNRSMSCSRDRPSAFRLPKNPAASRSLASENVAYAARTKLRGMGMTAIRGRVVGTEGKVTSKRIKPGMEKCLEPARLQAAAAICHAANASPPNRQASAMRWTTPRTEFEDITASPMVAPSTMNPAIL
jgi:hypothetical protein